MHVYVSARDDAQDGYGFPFHVRDGIDYHRTGSQNGSPFRFINTASREELTFIMNIILKTASVLALAATAALAFSSQSFAWDKKEVKVGVVGENNEQWKPIIKKLKEEGVDLQIVKFNDYQLPNRALEDGDIDLHACMTGKFLNTESKDHGYHLKAIGTTLIAPLGVYSKKIKSLSELKDGDSIAIPSDPITTGRALRMLEANKIITIKDNAGWTPSKADITSNPKNIKFYWVDPGNAYAAMDDVAASFINGGFASDHGLVLKRDAIAYENTEGWGLDNPFVNIIASREKEADKPLFKHIVDLYHTKEVADIITTQYKGAIFPAFKY